MDPEALVKTMADDVWIVALLVLLILGLIFLVKMKGFQVRLLNPAVWKKIKTNEKEIEKDNNKISALESFFIGLGNHLGVGNITGIASAIMMGGPGAIFWMWLFSIIGACVTFMESALAQIYKNKGEDGKFYGSPAWYAKKGLNAKKIAFCMAVAGVVLYCSNLLFQTSNAVSSMTNAIEMPEATVAFAAIFAFLTFIAIIGGTKRVAKISSKIVPIMAVFWLVLALFTIFSNWQNIPQSFGMIFTYAFDGSQFDPNSPFFGGLVGTVIVTAMRRGEYSNDAGTGTMATVSAMADVKHPVRIAIMQSVGVYLSTVVLCTITGLVILSYGNYAEIRGIGENFAPLVQYIMSQTALGASAAYFISIILFVFAYTTIISCFVVGTVDIQYLSDSKSIYYWWIVVATASVFIGGIMTNDTAQSVVDIATALIVILNLYIIYRLKDRVFEALEDYKRQKKEGVAEPVFKKSSLSDQNGVTEWD